MTEYFYTSSLVYAAAAVEQGFENGESCETRKHGEHWWDEVLFDFCDKWRFPKTPHNVALMNKQEFDVVKQIGKAIAFNKVGIISYNMNRKLYVYHSGFDDLHLDNWIIIERNGFVFPVWDKEGV
jgi:hypothetical protein